VIGYAPFKVQKQMVTLFLFGFVTVFITSMLSFMSLSKDTGKKILGILTVITYILLNIQIISAMPAIIRQKDASPIKLSVALGLFSAGAFWMSYGIVTNDIVLLFN
jgi:uncharacterized membrane protein